MSRDYEVGRGRPPKHSRFVKGRSGNPRGRPRKSNTRSVQKIVEEELDRVLTGSDGGSITARRLVVRGVIARASKGDIRAAEWLLKVGPADAFADGPMQVTLVFPEEEERRKQVLADNERRRREQGGGHCEGGCGAPAEPSPPLQPLDGVAACDPGL